MSEVVKEAIELAHYLADMICFHAVVQEGAEHKHDTWEP